MPYEWYYPKKVIPSFKPKNFVTVCIKINTNGTTIEANDKPTLGKFFLYTNFQYFLYFLNILLNSFLSNSLLDHQRELDKFFFQPFTIKYAHNVYWNCK